jgi:hypothetical protein
MAERAQGTGAVQLVAEQGGAWVALLDRNTELTSVEEFVGDASGRGRPLAGESPRQLIEPLLAQVSDRKGGRAAFGCCLARRATLRAATDRREGAPRHSPAGASRSLPADANLAARRELLLVVDDLHWCDVSYLSWLAYLLTRLEDLGVSIVVALRPLEQDVDPSLVGQISSCSQLAAALDQSGRA